MIRTIRENDKYILVKAMTGMGCSFIRKSDNEQSLFDCDFDEKAAIVMSDKKFNELAENEITNFKIIR